MRNLKINTIIAVVVIALLAFILTLPGCTSTKHITKETVSVDSTALMEKSDSIRILKNENETLTSEIRQLQYAGVVFDTCWLPGDTVVNTVTITKEGELQATGKIASATVSKSVLTKIVNEKQRIIDSLSAVKQKESIRYVTRTEYKEKEKKVTFLPWWFWLITAAFALLWLRKQFFIK